MKQQESFTSSRLSAVKGDAKFTTRAQIVKLQSAQEIQKISLKINDAKRSKQLSLGWTPYSLTSIVKMKKSFWNIENLRTRLELNRENEANLNFGRSGFLTESSLIIHR